MKPDHVVEALEAVAQQLGVKVRYDNLGPGGLLSGGGLCRLRGEWTAIVDKKAPANDKASVLLEALAAFDVESIAAPPKVKQLLMNRRQAFLVANGNAQSAPAA